MNNVVDHWQDMRAKLTPPNSVLWLFDFDGTLAPIARRPSLASMSKPVRQLLITLARRFPHRVGVVSGRPLHQLRRKTGISGLLYGGTHGFEIWARHELWRRPVSAARLRKLDQLRVQLERTVQNIRGMRIEDKTWTLAVHYREVRPTNRLRAAAIIGKCRHLASQMGFKVQEGLKAIEILSDAEWNKGQAVRRLKALCGSSCVFYAGDDATDETVFRVLKRSDVSVHVGPGASRAQYILKHQSGITDLLRRISTL